MRVKKCCVCDKTFIVAPESIYKIAVNGKIQHLCSWGCYINLQKEVEAKKTPKEGKYADR